MALVIRRSAVKFNLEYSVDASLRLAHSQQALDFIRLAPSAIFANEKPLSGSSHYCVFVLTVTSPESLNFVGSHGRTFPGFIFAQVIGTCIRFVYKAISYRITYADIYFHIRSLAPSPFLAVPFTHVTFGIQRLGQL